MKSVGEKTTSGVESSLWSAIDGSWSLGSSGTAKVSPDHRPGRHGSRTPRNKQRKDVVSHENDQGQNRCTPGGTRVPDGPPPLDPIMPPVLPIPMVADGTDGDAQFCSNFLNGLYDTCESKPKPRGKLGDTQWNQWE